MNNNPWMNGHEFCDIQLFYFDGFNEKIYLYTLYSMYRICYSLIRKMVNQMEDNFVYGISETRANIAKIMNDVSHGLISETRNMTTDEEMFMINNKMFNSLLSLVDVKNTIEYDENIKIYTIYNEIIPQFFGEGSTEKDAIENMVDEVIEFMNDYKENIYMYSSVFNGTQQFLLGNLLLNLNDKEKVKEILKVV